MSPLAARWLARYTTIPAGTCFRLFKLSKVLPAGVVFPYNFGYVPGTLGADGDPLDVLVLMDEPAFTGCLLAAGAASRPSAC